MLLGNVLGFIEGRAGIVCSASNTTSRAVSPLSTTAHLPTVSCDTGLEIKNINEHNLKHLDQLNQPFQPRISPFQPDDCLDVSFKPILNGFCSSRTDKFTA